MSTAQWTFKAQMDDTELRDYGEQINSRKSLRMVPTANYRTLMLRPLRSNAIASI